MNPSATYATPPPVDIDGFPTNILPPRDEIETRVFAREVAISRIFGPGAPNYTKLWLAYRTRARRDLLWFSRHILGLSRLTEKVHRPAADFVMSIFLKPHGFGSFRDPRGNGKSSLASIAGPLWIAIQDPIECIERGWPILGRESRLGIVALKDEFAKKFFRLIQETIEGSQEMVRHFPEIYPEKKGVWNLEEMTLRRQLTGKMEPLTSNPLFTKYPAATPFIDATFTKRSLEAGTAGPHSNGEIIDDPVNSKTWSSQVNIDNAVHGIHQSYNVTRTERGFRLVTGNHWVTNDVCQTIDELDVGWKVFMRSITACDGCKDGYVTDASGLVPMGDDGLPQHKHEGGTFTHAMVEADGSLPDPAQVRKSCGTMHIYMAQYENAPMAGEATWWSSSMLPSFEINRCQPTNLGSKHHTFLHADGALCGNCAVRYPMGEGLDAARLRDLPITIAIDPAHGSLDPRSSENAISTLARTPADSILFLDGWAEKLDDPLALLTEIIRILRRFRYARRIKIAVESVGYQKILKGLLLREIVKEKITWISTEKDIVLVPRSSKVEQWAFIRDVVGPLIMGRALLVNRSVRGADKAILQIEGAPIRKPNDLLNSLAFHPHLWDRKAPKTRKEHHQRTMEDRSRRWETKRKAGKTGTGW